jgi:multiple sugar transport system permease protein
VKERRKIFTRGLVERVYSYALIAPTILVLFAVNIYPLVYSLNISLRNFNLTRPAFMHSFVGLANFRNLLSDAFFAKSCWVTLRFVLGSVSLELILGFAIALLLWRLGERGRFLLSVFLLPMMLTPIIVGLMWRFMLNYNVGLVNHFVSFLGLERVPFLASENSALLSVMLVDAWQWTPFMVLLLYSGLQSMPADPFEAARIDGASDLQMFRYVTLPSMRPIILITVLIRGMDALREYDKIYTMTNGGPGNATETASFFIYRQAFKFFDMGYAAAAAFILLVISVIVSQLFVSRLSD